MASRSSQSLAAGGARQCRALAPWDGGRVGSTRTGLLSMGTNPGDGRGRCTGVTGTAGADRRTPSYGNRSAPLLSSRQMQPIVLWIGVSR